MYNFSIKVLIIEDDKIILNSLKEYLENWEYEVFTDSGIGIMEDIKNIKPDITLTDIILPSFNGYFWCEKIRDTTDIPVIFISSKSEDLNIIMGVQTGADDYIAGPFNFDILMVKISAIVKRYYGSNTIKSASDFNDAVLSTNEFRLEYINKDTNLTRTGTLILKSLFETKGEIVTRERLMDQYRQNDFFIDNSTLVVSINRIKKRSGKLGLDSFLLVEEHSGYYLNNGSN